MASAGNSDSYSKFIHQTPHLTLNCIVGEVHEGYDSGSFLGYAQGIAEQARYDDIRARTEPPKKPYVIECWASDALGY